MKRYIALFLATLFLMPSGIFALEVKKDTARTIAVGPFLDVGDGFTPETGIGALSTSDEADILPPNGAAAVDIKGDTMTAVANCDGWYHITLAAASTATLGHHTLVFQDDTVYLPVFVDFEVVSANYWDTKYGTDVMQADLTQMGGVAQSATDLKDFADAGYNPTTDKVTGVLLADTVTTLTGHTAQTGDSFLRIGVAGASLTGLPWNASWDTEVMQANMIQIAGNSLLGNAATLTLKQLDIQNNAGSALIAKGTGGNGHGMELAGNGTGEGLSSTGGTTGHGGAFLGGATSGAGIFAVGGESGNGVLARGGNTDGHGIYSHAQTLGSGGVFVATGGNYAGINTTGGGTQAGILSTGGATGHGIEAVGGGTSGDGLYATGGTDGDGMQLVGTTSGHGLNCDGAGAGEGIAATGGGTNGHGMTLDGGATNSNGLFVAGTGTGHGMYVEGGASGGAGIYAKASANNDAGMELVKHGTGVDLDADNLAYLMGHALSNTATLPEVTDSSALAVMLTKTDGDVSDYDFTTESLEAIRDAMALAAGVTVTSIGNNVITDAACAANFDTLVNDEVCDVLKTDTISELGVAAPAATPTFETGLMLLYMDKRNKTETTAAEYRITNNAETVITESNISDDGATFTKEEFGAVD